ncbi:MAG: Glutamyl-tRNA synthetase, class Ic [Rickettsiales bacterium]|jgi:glutamyl-tRNA synthetase|nr:Glutamyl-tRNA synthetase, class Ic [Rickettsiales bacterium]
MTVITRFAPSPTGFLHIGGARTALFNWLFARHNKGKFLLRIEDTDRERSTQEAIDAILNSMRWLGLDWDGEETYQFSRAGRHKEVAEEMIARGNAYYCYCSAEEVTAMREKARAEGKPIQYDRTCRERKNAPDGIKPVVRLKAPLTGETIIRDSVQGDVRIANEQMDDLVLLRSDGTPTYMLAVVVDDHDMGVTHIIRGDDHLTNAGRQILIYQAMGWDIPSFSHIPLIHGPDGAKLSKRHGALGVESYRDMGYLPEAMRNYLLRLGWSHGDEEIIPTDKAIEWFTLDTIGKAPSRFDMKKLDHVNGHYIREADNARLTDLILPKLEEKLGASVTPAHRARLIQGMEGLKQRAKTLLELADTALFYATDKPLPFTEQAEKQLSTHGASLLPRLLPLFEGLASWEHDALESLVKEFTTTEGVKMGDVAQSVRSSLAYSTVSPSIFEVMPILGKEESLRRIRHAVSVKLSA